MLWPPHPRCLTAWCNVGSLDGHLYALDAAAGDLLWRHAMGGGMASTPTVSDGVVYVGSKDNHLYAVKAGTRKGPVPDDLLWRYQTGGFRVHDAHGDRRRGVLWLN